MYEHWFDILIRHCEVNGNRPCDGSITWMRTEPDAMTALANCPRGDWLLWIAVMIGVKKEKIVLASCKCARQALVYIPDGETIPLEAIETAEKWARGDATLDDVRAANVAAYDAYTAACAAYDAANAVAAAHVAGAAAYASAYADAAANAAVHITDAAAYAAACAAANAAAHVVVAAYVAEAAAYVAEAAATACAAAGDSREDSFRLSADIVREMIGEEMLQSWKGVLACY